MTLITLSLTSRVFLENQHIEIHVPKGWSLAETPVDPNTVLKLTIALKIRTAEEIESLFWSVSDPNSPQYTQYVDLDYFIENHSTPDKVVQKITQWLEESGVNKISYNPTRDFVTIEVPVKIAEKMFQVHFMHFYNQDYGTIIRTLQPYSVPKHIAEEVVFVTGMNRFPPKPLKAIYTTKRSIQQDSITPSTIWSVFNTSGITGKAAGNLQAVAQFLQQYFDPADLQTFQQQMNLQNQPAAKIIGPNDPTNPGTEALLDIEYIIGTAPLIPTWFWSTDGLYNGQEPFVQWAMNVNADTTIPLVMSVSYGDEESSVDKGYTDRLNIELQKMALRGTSVLFASGDNGVGCTSSCIQDPNWPASSPYVTAVGGFFSNSGSLSGDSISSGGFSNYYSVPSYQVNAVQRYLANTQNLPPSNIYNKTSRAMPDVSSFSENVIVVQSGSQEGVGGTSCAAPVFSGIISLVNDYLLQNNKKPLGFLNNAIYQIGANTPSAFIDITTGSNDNGCCAGFPATTGWDAITGWGGPNFPVLLQALAALQK